MPTVQLADIMDIIVYNDLPNENTPEKTAFVESGAVVQTSLFNQVAAAAGRSGELPFWRDITMSDEANTSSDQSTLASPRKIVQDEQLVRKNYLNQGWSSMDLATELASSDPMTRIRSRIEAYWLRQWQRRVIATARGVFAANVAGNFAAGAPGTASDMVISIAAESTGGQSASTRWSRAAFVNAMFTMGDAVDSLSALAVHSFIYKQMVDLDDIDFIRDSQGTLLIPTFMGKRVIVDDSLPVIPGTTSGNKYLTILFGQGAIGFGQATPPNPTEVVREATAGHGGGEEQIWTRKTWLIHPFGHSNLNATATGNSGQQTIADLQLAANWRRQLTRKNVPMAFLLTN